MSAATAQAEAVDPVHKAWADAFIEGWLAPTSADAFADHFEPWLDPEVRMIQPQMPTTVGLVAFRERFVRPTFELMGDLHAEVHRWAGHGDTLFLEITLRGTLGGKPVAWQATDRVTLRDGVAIERKSYFDPAPLMRAVASRPRAWQPFLRAQLRRLAHRSRKDHAR